MKLVDLLNVMPGYKRLLMHDDTKELGDGDFVDTTNEFSEFVDSILNKVMTTTETMTTVWFEYYKDYLDYDVVGIYPSEAANNDFLKSYTLFDTIVIKEPELVKAKEKSETLGYILTLFYKNSGADTSNDIKLPLSTPEVTKFLNQWKSGHSQGTVTVSPYGFEAQIDLNLSDYIYYSTTPFYTEDDISRLNTGHPIKFIRKQGEQK